MNKSIMTVTLVKDPEITQGGDYLIAKYRGAVRRGRKNAEGNYESDFFDFVAMNKLDAKSGPANFARDYMRKGKMFLVISSAQNNNYTDKNGVKHYSDKFMVETQEFMGSKTDTTTAESAPDSENAQPDGFMDLSGIDMETLPFGE